MKNIKNNNLKNKEIVLGICGGIAAYKIPELIRLLCYQEAKVTCILTANGAKFVTALTLQTLSKNKVYENMFDPFDWNIEHISIADKADVIIVAPATADTIARLACGQADDLLASVILAAKSQVLICPAMNERMWLHKATQNNVLTLKSYGYKFVDPQEGELACGIKGIGRLAGINTILNKIVEIINS